MGLSWIIDKLRHRKSSQRPPPTAGSLAHAKPCASLKWESEKEVSALTAQFHHLGFQRIGTFEVHSFTGGHQEILVFYYPAAHFYGMIFKPSGSTIPFELCCQTDDPQGISVSNDLDHQTWHEPPHGLVFKKAGASLEELFQELLQRAAGKDRVPAGAETFTEDFEFCMEFTAQRRLEQDARNQTDEMRRQP